MGRANQLPEGLNLMRVLVLALGIALAGVPAAAQSQTGGADAAVATARALWEGPTGYITTAARELPESLYAYRPTTEVRSFGQLVGHVAGAQNLICAAALGEPGGAEDDIERTLTSKTELVAALRKSTEYCARAYAQSDQAARQKTRLFGQERSRLFALGLNATHNAEHYGNIVTYLRLNGIVPPSSR